MGHRTPDHGDGATPDPERSALQRTLRGVSEGLVMLPPDSRFERSIDEFRGGLLLALAGAPPAGCQSDSERERDGLEVILSGIRRGIDRMPPGSPSTRVFSTVLEDVEYRLRALEGIG